MESKLRAAIQLWQFEEIQCEKIQRELQSIHQRYDALTTQLEQLSVLRQTTVQHINKGERLCRALLLNANQTSVMLQTTFSHFEQERSILQAEIRAIQDRLYYKKTRVKGLENLVHQWRDLQKTTKIKQEQRVVEDIINARVRFNA
ncbi:hypothetical protein BS333_19830 [Vibrio azureus]|uniref:Flagellar FliJ protein n=1 Tax=Vibrio azureus NBRC 104587 TaxID=1219077 RepID=U3AQL3_9VIBR|nr:hypothetical protein [Vibrio azureus]AUI88558.1 hypothetical protein BS333_19830 [Vibrio azureus]GAD76050.1 hypothetical protein VAZ01S_035_00580 [Vibrio azureus NBRC 104587]